MEIIWAKQVTNVEGKDIPSEGPHWKIYQSVILLVYIVNI